MKRKLCFSLLRIAAGVSVALIGFWIILAQPSFQHHGASAQNVDLHRLRTHVEQLCKTWHPRDWNAPTNLYACGKYIEHHFEQAGARTERQDFEARGRYYFNVIGKFGPPESDLLVVGAHYDAFDETPGADDNASGVAALIELAYLLGANPPRRSVDLVAYALEEPPFFRTDQMGSAVHAQHLVASNRRVVGMIALEMVGYFRDDWGSQSYPSGLLYCLYPRRGNFIAVVGRWDHGAWIKKVKVAMKGATGLPVYSIRAPSLLPGIDFSDHLSYWKYDIPAVMITDTAFYRNHAYHETNDSPHTLDYHRMSRTVVAVHAAIASLADIP